PHSCRCALLPPAARYPLALHDALPISTISPASRCRTATRILTTTIIITAEASMLDDFLVRALAAGLGVALVAGPLGCFVVWRRRSEEHTSELQSRENLVCRLLLEKKNT